MSTTAGGKQRDWPEIAGYEVEAAIGRGGMGRVFLARDSKLGRHVAIKCLLHSSDPQLLRRFTDGVPNEEVASWAVKAETARAYLAGQPAPMIEAEAAITGEAPETLAASIVAKSDAYTAVIARVTGLRRSTNAAIAAAPTEELVWATIEVARAEAKSMAQSLGLDFP